MKITFNRSPIWTSIKFTDVPYSAMTDYLGAVRRVTSARPSGYQFTPSYRNKTWDGYIRLYKNNHFPTGLLDDVRQSVVAAGIEAWEIIDNPDCVIKPIDHTVIQPDMLVGITLRDYQLDAVKRLLDYGRGIAKMATNSGKTEVIAAMCRAIDDKVLVLTTKRELMYQTSERLCKRLGGEVIGCIGDGVHRVEPITVAMIQTLCRHDNLQEEFRGVQCVMFDECHHIPSTTSQKVLMGIPAPMRFGFSGTPLHNNDLTDLMLIGATGPVLVDVTNADLIEAGVSSMPYVDMYVVESDDGFYDKWDRVYTKCIVNNEQRNAIIIREVLNENAEATLVLVDRLEHGHKLQAAIPGSIFAHGSLPTDERRAILDKLRQGSHTVVIATPIFDEGVDVPSVDMLVLAAGGETHIRLLQRIGRGMRRKESGKLRVIDFVDDTSTYLLSHSQHRVELYEREGFAVRLVE